MSGHHDFFEDLEAKTPREKILADEYEVLTRAVLQLARLREQRGLTQKALAQAMDVAQPTLSKLEHGDDMRVTTLTKYIGAMGGGLRLMAVFDDGEVDLGLLKLGAKSGFLMSSHGWHKATPVRRRRPPRHRATGQATKSGI